MIFFFSGTGNSRYLAHRLGESLGDEVREMSFQAMRSLADIADERVVWVFPVHSWGMPKLVVEFMARVSAPASSRHFMVCSCGDDIGLTHRQWRAQVESRGWVPVGAYSVIMPNTYVLLPGFDVDAKEVEGEKLSRVPERIDDIAKRIRLGREGDDVHPGDFSGLKSRVLYPLFERFMQSPRPFRCDSTRCYGCGKCAAHCPMGNITLDGDRRPVWGDNCTMCLSCYHVCPVHAVEYGSRTKNKGQYLCPLR